MKSVRPFGVSFYIRQNKSARKAYSVYCCIRVYESSPEELCVAREIKRDDWDLRKGRLKQGSDHLLKLSVFLEAIRSKLFEIYLDIKLNKDELSAENIKNIYLGKGTHDYTILELTDQAIKKYEKELAPGSIKNYSATRAYIQAFCKVKYKPGDVRLKFLTCVFIDELKTYILNNPLKPNDPCTNNCCMKHMERIKKIMT